MKTKKKSLCLKGKNHASELILPLETRKKKGEIQLHYRCQKCGKKYWKNSTKEGLAFLFIRQKHGEL